MCLHGVLWKSIVFAGTVHENFRLNRFRRMDDVLVRLIFLIQFYPMFRLEYDARASIDLTPQNYRSPGVLPA